MRQKFLGLVCLIYAFIIGFLWILGGMKNFLAPNMQVYLKLSLFPFVLMGITLLLNPNSKSEFHWSDLVLLLPIVFLFTAGDGRLTVFFAENRSTPLPNMDLIEEDTEEEPQEVYYDFSNIDFEINDSNFIDVATYFTYPKAIELFEGKSIHVKGFAMKNSYMQKGYFALGRYSITCCAADAEFVGFLSKYDTSKITEGSWYEIKGILEKTKTTSGTEMLSIKVLECEEIEEEEQYVYPCYSYGDGTCSDTKKYQFQY